MANDTEERSRIDQGYEEGAGAYRSLHEQEQQASFDRDFHELTSPDHMAKDGQRQNSSTSAGSAVEKREQSDSPWRYSRGSTNQKKRAHFSRNKKFLTGAGIGGVSGIIITVFMMMLPLRLEMLIQNILSSASAIPGYATERRIEYLVTRTLAVRVLQIHNSNLDNDVVFCKDAGLACSLLRTYTTDLFERKYGIQMRKVANGVQIDIRADGRTRLGGKAQSWTVTGQRIGSGAVDTQTANIVREIKTLDNGQMKRRIKDVIDTKMKHKTFIHRLVARNLLMRKYGVTHWRAFPKTQAAIAEKRIQFRTKMALNVYGRVSSRLALAMTCMSSPAACELVYKELSASPESLAELEKDANDSSKTQAERDEAKQKLERAKARNSILAKAAGMKMTEEEINSTRGRALNKLLSSKVLNAAGGPLVVIGILDIFFKGVNAVDEGVLDEVSQDIVSQAYMAYAFGDEVSSIVINEQMKMGDADIEIIGIANETLEGIESNPLWAYENGLGGSLVSMNPLQQTAMAANGGITTNCISSNDNEIKPITLEPGELVCPEMRVVRNYTEYWKSLPSWGVVAGVAEAWEASIGAIFTLVGDAVGWLLSKIPLLDKLIDFAAGLLKGPLEWLFTAIFSPPFVGPDAPGENNYTALSGALRIQQNELMKAGVELDGVVLGGGGIVLSNEEIAHINQEMMQREVDDFKSQSVMAKLFNPRLKGSLAQQALLTTPTSPSSALAALPSMPMRSLGLITSPKVNAAKITANPFNMPIYGYTPNDPIFEADPSLYTDEACSVSAMAREDSYNNDHPDWPIGVYNTSDPCALEKMVVGVMLASAGVDDDEYSLPDPTMPSTDVPSTTSPGAGGDYPIPENAELLADGKWRLKKNADYSAVPCPSELGVGRVERNPGTGTTVRVCTIDGQSVTSVIAQRTLDMIAAAAQQGINLTISSGYRSYEQQQRVYNRNCGGGRCNPPTAVPGTSNHEFGVAIDFGLNNVQLCRRPTPRATCNPGENVGYDFLVREGAKYGFHKLPMEAWHWSMDGR